jgi:hypothetical protein
LNRAVRADPEKEKKRQMMLDHLRQLKGQTIQLPQGPMGMASGRYRMREFLILPGEEYNITGTCAENPGAGDSQDRCIMVNGENEKTFLISSKSDAASQSGLRKSALGMVFGGVALTLVCLWLLLAHLGLF